jgi:hypothetical protein
VSSDDDDEITALPEMDIPFIRYERIALGSYAVHGQVVINGVAQHRRYECKNPVYGFRKLEQEIMDALLLGIRDEKKTAARSKAGTDNRRATILGVGGKDKAPPGKKRPDPDTG